MKSNDFSFSFQFQLHLTHYSTTLLLYSYAISISQEQETKSEPLVACPLGLIARIASSARPRRILIVTSKLG